LRLQVSHPWNLTPAQASQLQCELASRVITADRLGDVRFVAGVDVGFEQEGSVTRAAVAVLRFPQLTLHEYAIARRPTSFPYIPGFLSFREIPAVLDALDKLQQLPDLLLCDGQGIAHPRRFGIACHLGVLTDLPSIGVAKTRLIGTHGPLPETKGSRQPLYDRGEVVGAVLRTRDHVKPLYISSGHKISLATAIDYVLGCLTRYKLPETTRWADRIASDKRGTFD